VLMPISGRCLWKVVLNGGRKRHRPWVWISAQMIAAGMMASTVGHAQTPSELLSQADRLADQGNWLKAAPLYAKAEKEFELSPKCSSICMKSRFQ